MDFKLILFSICIMIFATKNVEMNKIFNGKKVSFSSKSSQKKHRKIINKYTTVKEISRSLASH